jgi:hypothetical protein
MCEALAQHPTCTARNMVMFFRSEGNARQKFRSTGKNENTLDMTRQWNEQVKVITLLRPSTGVTVEGEVRSVKHQV